MTRLPLILASAAIALSSVSAHAQQVYSWQHYADLSVDPFQSPVTLVYGVPETDDLQFFASCQIGAGGPYALVQIAADTAGLPNGAAASMMFTDGAGAGTILDSTIIGVNAEFGVTGVEMALSLDDGLFNLMQVRDVLSYAIPGGQGIEIATAGVAGPLIPWQPLRRLQGANCPCRARTPMAARCWGRFSRSMAINRSRSP